MASGHYDLIYAKPNGTDVQVQMVQLPSFENFSYEYGLPPHHFLQSHLSVLDQSVPLSECGRSDSQDSTKPWGASEGFEAAPSQSQPGKPHEIPTSDETDEETDEEIDDEPKTTPTIK